MFYILLNHTAIMIYLFMGIYVWKMDSKRKSNILFLILCLMFVFISLEQLIIINISNEETVYFMDRISQIGWLNYPGVLLSLSFQINQTNEEDYLNNKLKKTLIYLPGAIFTGYELFINSYSIRATQIVIVIRLIEYLYNYSYASLVFYNIWCWWKDSSSERTKKQAEILLTFGSLTIAFGALNDFVLLLPIDQFIFLILMFSIWHVNIKYKFLNLSSLITAEDIVDKITDIVIVINAEGIIISLNKKGEEVLGYKYSELTNSHLSKVISLDFNDLFQKSMINHNVMQDKEIYLKTNKGRLITISIDVFTVKDKTGDIMGYVIICQDKTLINKLQVEISERVTKEQELYYLSLHDSLTGLYNRTYFEKQIQKFNNLDNNCLGIIMCDLDGLKLVNDTLGHDVGDKLLINASSVIKSSLQAKDTVYRIGGDEFAILVPQSTEENMNKICSKIQKGVQEFNAKGPQLMLSISVGFAISRDSSKDVTELFKEADDNMYREKLNHNQSVRNTLVQGMMKTLEARDFITEGHADRLKEIMLKFAKYINLPASKLTNLQLLAQFHDIGKIGIPDRILFKPHSLSSKEKVEMQRHSEIGYRIALSLPDLQPIADLILKHHERWDGKGYPLGIKEDKIPIDCRILAIVDAFDAMTSDRPYRKAMTIGAAMTELKSNIGTQFDPRLVFEFLEMLGKDKDS